MPWQLNLLRSAYKIAKNTCSSTCASAGTLLWLDGGEQGDPITSSLHLRTANWTVYRLSFPSGVSPYPADWQPQQLSVQVRAYYTRAQGRVLYCSRTLEPVPTPSRRSAAEAAHALPRRLVASVEEQLAARAARQRAAASQQLQLEPASHAGQVHQDGVARRSMQQSATIDIQHPFPIKGKMPIIVYLASFCTTSGMQPAATTEASLREVLFNSQASLSNMYSQCSSSAAVIDGANSVILPVTIPCSGTKQDGSFMKWNTSTCGCVLPSCRCALGVNLLHSGTLLFSKFTRKQPERYRAYIVTG